MLLDFIFKVNKFTIETLPTHMNISDPYRRTEREIVSTKSRVDKKEEHYLLEV
jgi:hypothetical protein